MKLKVLKKEVFIDIKNTVYRRIFFLILLFLLLQIIVYFNNIGYLDIPARILYFFDIVIFSVVVVILMNVLLRFTVSKVFNFQEKETEIEQRIFITKVYTIFLYFLALSAIMWRVGVSLSNITLFIGILTTAIAFALRDVILSFIVWLIILTKNPFRINDVVSIGDDVGLVSRIGTFYVTIDTGNANEPYIKIPNKIFFEKSLINMGKRMRHTIKVSLKQIPKDFNKEIVKVNEYINENAGDARIQVDHEGIVPILIINFTLPFKESDKKNEIVLGVNDLLRKHIKTK